MFSSIIAAAKVAWNKALEIGTQAISGLQHIAWRTVEVLTPTLSAAGMVGIAVLSGLAMAQAAQEAEMQAVKARVLADRLLLGEVAADDIDATVAACAAYRVHAAAHSWVWDLPSTRELRRAARARSVLHLLLV